MSRAKIPDIARKAGLSTATVDRALNGRKGVSAANRHRVFKAAEDLGYLPSEGTVHLPARPAHLAFLIPFSQNAFIRDVAHHIQEFAAGLELVASCSIVTMNGLGAEALERGLDAISPRVKGVGVITTDTSGTRAILTRLCDSGVRAITIASDVTGTPRSAYIGVDNYVAGRTAGQIMGMLVGHRSGSVGLFLGSHAFHGHQEREHGFRDYFGDALPNLVLHPGVETGEDNARSYSAATDLLRSATDLVGIYCLGAARTGIVEAIETSAQTQRPRVIVHDLTENSRGWLMNDLVDVVIDQNARLVGQQAVIRLLGSIAASTPLLSYQDIEPQILFRENVPADMPGKDRRFVASDPTTSVPD